MVKKTIPQSYSKKNDWNHAASLIASGGVVIIPTDTVYGIVCQAFNKVAVGRVYSIRERNLKKPCIVLISSIMDLGRFGVVMSERDRDTVKKIWPAPVSIIFPCNDEKLSYLHRGTGSLAFRVPHDDYLRDLIKKTGPIIAPSANKEGDAPVGDIAEARRIFGDSIDGYVEGKNQNGLPSTVITLVEGSPVVIRPGRYRFI